MKPGIFIKDKIKKSNPHKLKQLCDRYNIPIFMGELWLNELKLSKLEQDRPAQESAKILGLL